MEPRRWILGFFLVCGRLAAPAATGGNTLRYRVDEESSPDTVIGNLARDLSWTPASGFRMMKRQNASLVRLRENSGELAVAGRLDRERLCRRRLPCLVSFDVLSLSGERFRLVHVEVEVRDVNDNAPRFPRRETAVEVSENAAVGSRVALDAAEDEDVGSNDVQSYQISVNSHFTIDVMTRADGVKYAELVLMRELDRETQAAHVLELVATDGGSPPRSGDTKVVVRVQDFNDNSPVFEQNNFSVDLPEDAPPGYVILDLNAADADEGANGEVVFGFGQQVSAEIRRLFAVDPRSGRLTLESPVDFEDKKTYELDVQATDLGPNPTPSACKIVIHVQDVNDNPPEVTITPMTSTAAGVAYISEAAEPDSFVALISTADRDSGPNGRVQCALYGHAHFALRRAREDSYTLVTTAALDRERTAEYNLTVMAEDLGSPPLRTVSRYTVRLADENDNAPAFATPAHEVCVEENNAPGAYVTTVAATDLDVGRNAKITYRLVDRLVMGSLVSTFVSLDPASGSLYALRSFNYEVMKRLEVGVQASDGGFPQLHGTATVTLKIVDQNDNAPSIVQPVLLNGTAEVPLPRDAPPGYVVTQVRARDADEGRNAELTFNLVDGGDLGFSINRATGQITVGRKLPHDLADAVRVRVAVSDAGQPPLTSTATIRLVPTAAAPAGDNFYAKSEEEAPGQWDESIVIIAVLAGSCTVLLVAIILITTICSRHKRGDRRGGGAPRDKGDVPRLEQGEKGNAMALIADHGGGMFDVRASQAVFVIPAAPTSSEDSSPKDRKDKTCPFKSKGRALDGKMEGYCTLPGYGKETTRPVTIWKGNSMTTISARDPQISGKDSGKGDSDFNDSDSDISDGNKKDCMAVNGLWACTSECKILGHSDRCWSPSAIRPGGNPANRHLSTFAKTATLPRDGHGKGQAAKAVHEKAQHRKFDYILVCPPQPEKIPESEEMSIAAYTPCAKMFPADDDEDSFPKS
ncbi:protocadherin-8 [Denticeps clupeoides]|uniref:Cadherin domain-containing protein n=1 Tax=Denticeps clupeoides TaxID=299321 RepID=A0A8C4B3X8_9TELE|nr:protocadherin-8-like [Denticeps clupeoides]